MNLAPIFGCLVTYLHLRFFINQQISAENSSLAQAELHSQLPVQSRIWFGLILHSSYVYYEFICAAALHICLEHAISLYLPIPSCCCVLSVSPSTKPWALGKGCDINILLGTDNSTVIFSVFWRYMGLYISHHVLKTGASLLRVKDALICGYSACHY